MIDQRWVLRKLAYSQAAVIFLTMLLLPCTAYAQDFDAQVAMVLNPDPSIRVRGEKTLAFIIKSVLTNMDPEQLTDDCFLLGHFIDPENYDLAVGISIPRVWGKFLVLTKRNGHYAPAGPLIDVAYIESIESTRLISGPLEQIVLNVYGGGTETRQWGKNILRWDGGAMRMIWRWIRCSVDKKRAHGLRGEYIGRIIRSEIFIKNSVSGNAKEIITRTEVDHGVFSKKKGQKWELEEVTSHFENKVTHKWDESVFFYITRYGQILPPRVSVECRRGIAGTEESETLNGGMRVGLLDIPGIHADDQAYHAVIGKEHFCEIPRSAVHILDEGK